jgi:hypothetical protein
MLGIPQKDLLLIVRALSWYQIDALKNGDADAASHAAELMHEVSHNLEMEKKNGV